jgi:hypothetical protein
LLTLLVLNGGGRIQADLVSLREWDKQYGSNPATVSAAPVCRGAFYLF